MLHLLFTAWWEELGFKVRWIYHRIAKSICHNGESHSFEMNIYEVIQMNIKPWLTEDPAICAFKLGCFCIVIGGHHSMALDHLERYIASHPGTKEQPSIQSFHPFPGIWLKLIRVPLLFCLLRRYYCNPPRSFNGVVIILCYEVQ